MSGIRVIRPQPEDARALEGPFATMQVLIDGESGSQRLVQRVLRLGCGVVGHPGVGEDVLYVFTGTGLLTTTRRDEQHWLRPGMAVLIRCIAPAVVHNTGTEELSMISVWSPRPRDGFYSMPAHDHPIVTIHEDDQAPLPAGDDRYFKLLIQSEHMTQFVGFIDRSKAPPHTHTYEEAIYVLEGEGLVHAEGAATPIQPGSSIFLPPGTPHCLENAGPRVLKVLGVFSPPGSPADKREASSGGV